MCAQRAGRDTRAKGEAVAAGASPSELRSAGRGAARAQPAYVHLSVLISLVMCSSASRRGWVDFPNVFELETPAFFAKQRSPQKKEGQ